MATDDRLYAKYHVERVDGKPNGKCVVLELEDPLTWPALRVWADTVEAAGQPGLAEDVRLYLESYRSDHTNDSDTPWSLRWQD